jgi:hypothetical protein
LIQVDLFTRILSSTIVSTKGETVIFERLPEPIDALVIKETFSEAELSNILNELSSFTDKAKSAEGIWLTDIYKDMDMSPTHRNIMQSYFDARVSENLEGMNSAYGLYTMVNHHATQLRYFDDGQSSLLHFDSAVFTAMSFVFDEPKNFDGGSVTLQIGGSVAYEQEIENNMTIIFPSCYYVGISQVDVRDNTVFGSGLYTINSYLFI